jgi:hypothetical protein
MFDSCNNAQIKNGFLMFNNAALDVNSIGLVTRIALKLD